MNFYLYFKKFTSGWSKFSGSDFKTRRKLKLYIGIKILGFYKSLITFKCISILGLVLRISRSV